MFGSPTLFLTSRFEGVRAVVHKRCADKSSADPEGGGGGGRGPDPQENHKLYGFL